MAITSANQLELLQTAEAVAREKMIDPGLVVEAMEESLARAAKSRYGAEMDIRVSIDRKTGRATFTRVRTVVEDEELENYQAEMTVEQAKQYLDDPKVGDTFVEDLRASGASSVGEVVAGPTIQRVEGSSALYFVVVNQRIIAPSSAEGSGSEDPESTDAESGEPAAPTPPADESRTVRVGLLVQLDLDADLVSSVEVL